jgi:predicted nuclease of predicted toxin-antitoxin system
VKFLVDRCAGRRLADWLARQGHDVLEARKLGPDPGDSELLRRAEAERRVVVTIDTDFPKLVHLGGQGHAGMVRLPDVPLSRRIALVSEVLTRHTSELEAGAIITVKGGKIRISKSGS